MNIHERLTEMHSAGTPEPIPTSPGSGFKTSYAAPLVRIKRTEKAGEPKSIMDFIRRQVPSTAGRKNAKPHRLAGRNSKIRISNGAVT
jgi:hypothetical protein